MKIFRNARKRRLVNVRALVALSCICALFAPLPVMAQTVAPTYRTDVSWLVQLLIAVASASIPVFLTLVAAWLKVHLKVTKDSAASQVIDLAVTAGQQFVAAAIAKAPTTGVIDVKNKAISDWIGDLSVGTQAAMQLRGTTAATIAQRIDGALTLALMPGAAPATIPATAVKG